MTERSVTLAIAGMHCAACAQTIEKALRRVKGLRGGCLACGLVPKRGEEGKFLGGP